MRRRLTVLAAAVLVYLGVAGLFVISVGGLSRGEGGPALFGPRVAIVELEGVILEVDDIVRELKSHREITIGLGTAVTEIPNFTWSD